MTACWPTGFRIGTAESGLEPDAAVSADASAAAGGTTAGVRAARTADGFVPDLDSSASGQDSASEPGARTDVGALANIRDEDDAGVGPAEEDSQPAEPQPSRASGQAGWSALTDWAGLPSFDDATAFMFSTHEREGDRFSLIDPGNKDFNSFLAVCGDRPATINQQTDASVACGPGQTGYLVAADDGPGYVSRILLARGLADPSSSVLINLRPTAERVRIYIDEQPTPVFDGLWSAWASAQAPPFSEPLTGWSSGATVSYVPLSYRTQLRVFVDGLVSSPTLYYAQVDTQRVKDTEPFDEESITSEDARAELAALLETAGTADGSWFDEQVTLQGAGARTIWTRDRPGTLQHLELVLDAADASAIMNETSLRLSWDDGAAAIDLSLAVLFGARHVLAPFSTLPLSVTLEGDAVRLSLSLPMPFAKGARLELVHNMELTRSLHVSLGGTDALPRGEWGRLYTTFSEHADPQAGERFRVAALSGRGKYLGTLFYARGKADDSRSVSADELGFLEGDERLEIDGRVAGQGTGTDNYFNGGFYFRDGPFSSAFAALAQLTRDEARGTSEATLLRWTILSDALNFRQQFELSFEYGADRPATVRDYAAVGFYYQ